MNLDPEVSRYTMDGGVVSREEIRDRIQNNVIGDYEKHGFGRYAVVYKSTSEFIGFAGLKYMDEFEDVDLGYRLVRQYWGKGIATEASRPCLDYGFGDLGLERIIALAHAENVASIRVMQKLNFKFEKNTEVDRHPVVRYALSRPEFLSGD